MLGLDVTPLGRNASCNVIHSVTFLCRNCVTEGPGETCVVTVMVANRETCYWLLLVRFILKYGIIHLESWNVLLTATRPIYFEWRNNSMRTVKRVTDCYSSILFWMINYFRMFLKGVSKAPWLKTAKHVTCSFRFQMTIHLNLKLLLPSISWNTHCISYFTGKCWSLSVTSWKVQISLI